VQLTERVIRTTLHLVLPGKPLNSLKKFMKAEEALSKATLGTMMSQLRARVDLHPSLDNLLTSFVARRNTLAHHLNDIPGFAMTTENEVAQARHWIAMFVQDTDKVLRSFIALILDWQQQSGRPMPDSTIIDYVGQDFAEIVPRFFQAKD
jgi:hypothetical protein